MDNQTPIGQLGNMDGDVDIDSTVDDIINQINDDDSFQGDLDSQSMQQQQQQQQQPMQQQQQQQPMPQQQPMQQQQPMPQQPIQHQQQQYQQYQQQPMIQQPPPEDNIDTSGLNNNISNIGEIIINNLKQPLIIVILYILLNLKQIDNIFKFKNLSLLVNGETGELTFTSVLIKSIVLGLLFYVSSLFV